jgi:bacteriocin-like protein
MEAIMTEQTQQRKPNELNDEQLEAVTGGDLHVTRTVDKASPNLFSGCCTGKHIPTATL